MKTFERIIHIDTNQVGPTGHYFFDAIKEGQPLAPGFARGVIKIEVPTYKLSLRRRLKEINGSRYFVYHIVNGIESDSSEKVSYESFIVLITKLKKKFKNHELVWDVYPGQPVYEYAAKAKDLKEFIESTNDLIEVTVIE